jgi:DNA-directed RNA polymerase subunit RPC12/RpoP
MLTRAIKHGRNTSVTKDELLARSAYSCAVCGKRNATETIQRAGRGWKYCQTCAAEYERMRKGNYIPSRIGSLIAGGEILIPSGKRRRKRPIPICGL